MIQFYIHTHTLEYIKKKLHYYDMLAILAISGKIEELL
jgi:hypothetical protein